MGVLIWFYHNPRNFNPRKILTAPIGLISKGVEFSCASFDIWEEFVASCPLTRTPTQKLKNRFPTFGSQEIGSQEIELRLNGNNFWSSTIWVIQIQVQFTEFLSPKILEFNLLITVKVGNITEKHKLGNTIIHLKKQQGNQNHRYQLFWQKNLQKFWTKILTKISPRWILIRFPVSGFLKNSINWWYPVLSPKLCILKLKRENYWISILSLDASFQDSNLESFEIFWNFHRPSWFNHGKILFTKDARWSWPDHLVPSLLYWTV